MSNNNGTFMLNSNVLDVMGVMARQDFIHIREVSRLAGISPTTAGSILSGLEKQGILKKKVLGRNCFYSLNRNMNARKMLIMLEEYRFLKSGIADEAEKIIESLSSVKGMIDCIIISKDSILFITSLDHSTISSAIGNSSRKILTLTRENFRSNPDSNMVMEILKDYIIISGAEKFIEMAR